MMTRCRRLKLSPACWRKWADRTSSNQPVAFRCRMGRAACHVRWSPTLGICSSSRSSFCLFPSRCFGDHWTGWRLLSSKMPWCARTPSSWCWPLPETELWSSSRYQKSTKKLSSTSLIRVRNSNRRSKNLMRWKSVWKQAKANLPDRHHRSAEWLMILCIKRMRTMTFQMLMGDSTQIVMLHRSRRRSCEAADEAPGGAESRDSERCESRHLKKSRLRHSAGYPHFISFSGSKRRSKPWGAGYRVAEQHSSRAAQ